MGHYAFSWSVGSNRCDIVLSHRHLVIPESSARKYVVFVSFSDRSYCLTLYIQYVTCFYPAHSRCVKSAILETIVATYNTSGYCQEYRESFSCTYAGSFVVRTGQA